MPLNELGLKITGEDPELHESTPFEPEVTESPCKRRRKGPLPPDESFDDSPGFKLGGGLFKLEKAESLDSQDQDEPTKPEIKLMIPRKSVDSLLSS